MTDTTDTNAMREAAIKSKELSGIANYRKGDEAKRVFNAMLSEDLIIKLLDQLEAEHQRADRYNFVAMSALETQAEISEQLGINEDECDGSPEQVHEKIEMLQKEIAALKAKLANPVVLPKYAGDLNHENAFLRGVEATTNKIRAAGFTVKE